MPQRVWHSQGIGLGISFSRGRSQYHDAHRIPWYLATETEASISVCGASRDNISLAASLLSITTEWIPIASFWRNLLIFIVCTLRRYQNVCPLDTVIQVSWNPGIATGLETSLIMYGPFKSLSGGARNSIFPRQLALTTSSINLPYFLDSYDVCSGYSTEPNPNTFTYWSEHTRVSGMLLRTITSHLTAEWACYFMFYSSPGFRA
jgi:hypothetical protein